MLVQSTPPEQKTGWHDWLILGLILLLAAALRVHQMGDLPPGLYRDEAFHGLDALTVLAGERPLFFVANNGREPLYIYLVTLMVNGLGRTPLAIRLPAIIAGTVAILPTWLLVRAWFGRIPAHCTAFLWATTVWTIHLSRVGFRTILMPPLFALSLWLLTVAWRKKSNGIAFAAGCVYGFMFYSYLAARLTPLFLILLSAYCLWRMARGEWRTFAWRGVWFVAGSVLLVLPLVYVLLTTPELAGRTGQVSILHPDINGGDFWGTFWRHLGRTAAMFFVRGDTIVRHNPFGRPVFDFFMIMPFLLGVWHCLRRWRSPVAAAPLLWVGSMAIGTIFAEDAPHFLRAAGMLPGVLIFPALGLSQLLSWSTLAGGLGSHTERTTIWGALLTMVLMVGSLGMTINDYFVEYARSADTAYLFESAARELAEDINTRPAQDVFIDPRLQQGWPSTRYLIANPHHQKWQSTIPLSAPSTLFVWPWSGVDLSAATIDPPMHIAIATGALARGDLDAEALPLYVRYDLGAAEPPTLTVTFENAIALHAAHWQAQADVVHVDLTWAQLSEQRPLTAFVHILDRSGALIAQADAPPGGTHWNTAWWQPGITVTERRTLTLQTPFDVTVHNILIGVYETETLLRLQIDDPVQAADSWQLAP